MPVLNCSLLPGPLVYMQHWLLGHFKTVFVENEMWGAEGELTNFVPCSVQKKIGHVSPFNLFTVPCAMCHVLCEQPVLASLVVPLVSQEDC